MRLILSPAKKMIYEDIVPYRSLPVFAEDAAYLSSLLGQMDFTSLKKLWGCSDKLVLENTERLHNSGNAALSPALFSYVGLAYQYLGAESLTAGQLDYLDDHLYILSGMYGALKPFDGIRPYRLEMQAKLKNKYGDDLYAYWGKRISDLVCRDEDTVVDLASTEYSRCLRDHLPEHVRMIECVFAEEKNGKLIVKGTFAKMARGLMTRWMAENMIDTAAEIRKFSEGYLFTPDLSSDEKYVFVRVKREGEVI